MPGYSSILFDTRDGVGHITGLGRSRTLAAILTRLVA